MITQRKLLIFSALSFFIFALFYNLTHAITLDKATLGNILDKNFKDNLADKGLVSLVGSIVTPNDTFLFSYGFKDPVKQIPTTIDDFYYIGSTF